MRVSIAGFIACLMAVSAQAQYGGGSGTQADPYQIWTVGQLNTIGTVPNDWDKHFKLMADLDLKQLRGASVHVIGVEAGYGQPFSGVFDGNGKTISNLTCNTSGPGSLGLFGAVQGTGAMIKRLKLKGPVVNAGTSGTVGALVGSLDEGTIRRCLVEGGSVSGAFTVGGLVGSCRGTIINSSSSASVSVSDAYGGGLAGQNRGIITESQSTGQVSARSYAGGLVGENIGTVGDSYSTGGASAAKGYAGGLVASNSGQVHNCYSAGPVSAPQGAGGLIAGAQGQQSVTDSLWDRQSSGQSTSAGGSSKTTAQMKTAATFAGWDFAGTWTIQESVDYPRLQWEADPFPVPAPTTIEKVSGDNQAALAGRKLASPLTVCVKDQDDAGLAGIEVAFLIGEGGGTVSPASAVTDANGFASAELTLGAVPGATVVTAVVGALSARFTAEGLAPGYGGGTGTWDDPHQIYTAAQLYVIGTEPNDWDKHFKLMADIDLSRFSFDRAVIAPDVNDADGWSFDGTPFTGVMDGNSCTISHLVINGESNVGLFGKVGLGGVVAAVSLLDVNISGSGGLVGGLAGANSGDITQCSVTGLVDGDSMVGGLVGANSGYVTQCRSAGTVAGAVWVGGLVGDNGGTVAQSYSHALVDGYAAWIGGLVGTNNGTVVQCYSAGAVSDAFWSGGLVGSSLMGSTIASFWDTQTSRWFFSAGGTGKTTSQMKAASTFLAAGWDFANETANGTDDLWWIDEGRDYPRLWWEQDETTPEAVLELDAASFDAQIAEGVVLVDFYATWCSHCATQATILDEVVDRLQGRAQVAKLDIDAAPAIAQRYSVTAIPTCIIFREGAVASRFVGVTSADVLVQAVLSAVDPSRPSGR